MTTFEQVPLHGEDGEKNREREPLFSDSFIEGLAQFERGEPLKWGATPLNPYLPEIREQQEEVNNYSSLLFHKPPFEVSPELEEYVFICNQGRIHHRLARNFESFGHRKQTDLSLTPENLQEIQYRVLLGQASPAEVITIGTQLGIPTYELASITHPYGQRIDEELESMRQAVVDGVLYHGGEAYQNPEKTYKIKSASHLDSHDMQGEQTVGEIIKSLRMTRTKKLGALPDGTCIYERSSFVYVLTEDQLLEVKQIPFDKEWSKKTLEMPGLMEEIEEAIKENNYSKAIPISTTSYAVNDDVVEERYGDREAYKQREREFGTGELQKIDMAPPSTMREIDIPNQGFAPGWLERALRNL